MQEPRSTSTLELVVNEQQLQNMSQVDLTRAGVNDTTRQEQQESGFKFKQIKEWPTRLKENFCAKMDEAKSKSNCKTEFVFQVIQTFSGTIIWLLCFIFTIIVPIFLFFIGLVNLENCQDRPSLPYYVFATGFTMTASNLFNLALTLDYPILTNHSILTNDIKNTIASIINIIFNCVVAFLYILSAYMVFTVGKKTGNKSGGTENQVESSETEVDCSPLLYNFTFWFIVLTLSLMAKLILVASAFFIYNKYRLAIIKGSTPRSQTNNISTNPASAF